MDDQCTLLGAEKFGSVDNLVELVQRLYFYPSLQENLLCIIDLNQFPAAIVWL